MNLYFVAELIWHNNHAGHPKLSTKQAKLCIEGSIGYNSGTRLSVPPPQSGVLKTYMIKKQPMSSYIFTNYSKIEYYLDKWINYEEKV